MRSQQKRCVCDKNPVEFVVLGWILQPFEVLQVTLLPQNIGKLSNTLQNSAS
jgi:hypothetical protein